MDESLMEDDSRVTVQEAALRFDMAYVLTRMPGDKAGEPPLPTSTGFNTKLV